MITKRKKEIVALREDGLTMQKIADIMGCSRQHIQATLGKGTKIHRIIPMKTCGKCGNVYQPIHNRQSTCGCLRTNEWKLNCRICHKKVGTILYAKNKSASKNKTLLYFCCNDCNTKRAKLYRSNNGGKIKRISDRYRKNNRKKSNAWSYLNWSVKHGKLGKPDKCEMCGVSGRLDGHHPDYDKPLEVLWVCRKCHKSLHKNADVV